jgi:four helix bundle protein
MPNGENGKQPRAEKKKREYDLAERTTTFGQRIIDFAKRLPRTPVNVPIIRQLVKAGTSIGANNREADDAVSRRDFRNKIGYCKKEANETKYWLRMAAAAEPKVKEEARTIWQEANELHRIFKASFKTASSDPVLRSDEGTEH